MYRPLLLISALTLGLATTAPAVMADSDRDERRGDRHGQSWSHDSRNDHRRDRDHDRRGEHHRREHHRREHVRRGHDHDRHRHQGRPHWHDSRDYRWRGSRYSMPRYHAPRGYVRQQWRPGHRVPPSYRHSRYVVNNYQQYRLRPPPRHHNWVRVDNDVVLTAVNTGVVSAVVHGIFR